MTSTPAILKGIVHGKTIELEQEPGLPDGQEVSVVVQPLDATAGCQTDDFRSIRTPAEVVVPLLPSRVP